MALEKVYLFFILFLLFVGFFLDRLSDYLDDKSWTDILPDELKSFYNEEKYRLARSYDKAKSSLGLYSSFISFIITFLVLFFGGFGKLDDFVRQYTNDTFWTAFLFFGIIAVASDILQAPFNWYNTFVIEKNFGFNKTTVQTYIMDKVKGAVLGALLGGVILWLLIQTYEQSQSYFWILAWVIITVFSLFMATFYTSIIVPIFNKLTPLEAGALRDEIEKYAQKESFSLKNIFVIDGSKRSSKANAYFSGLGSKKSIVLYDTLIQNHSTEEVVAVLAHEIGHYKKKHTFYGLFSGIIQTGLTFYLLSFFLGSKALALALGSENPSFHLSILAFGFLYSPISLILGMFSSMLSRKHEYEADAFAKNTYSAEHLSNALKKLSVDNLSNLTPHPLNVFLFYSHPTLLQRLEKLKN
jgi:STE24 endopeptidase